MLNKTNKPIVFCLHPLEPLFFSADRWNFHVTLLSKTSGCLLKAEFHSRWWKHQLGALRRAMGLTKWCRVRARKKLSWGGHGRKRGTGLRVRRLASNLLWTLNPSDLHWLIRFASQGDYCSSLIENLHTVATGHSPWCSEIQGRRKQGHLLPLLLLGVRRVFLEASWSTSPFSLTESQASQDQPWGTQLWEEGVDFWVWLRFS